VIVVVSTRPRLLRRAAETGLGGLADVARQKMRKSWD
jgi:hypothetical protein